MNEGKPSKVDPSMLNDLTSQPSQVEGKLTRDIQSKIGMQLRSMYDDVVKEGVPDRFAELLRKLDDSSGGSA